MRLSSRLGAPCLQGQVPVDRGVRAPTAIPFGDDGCDPYRKCVPRCSKIEAAM